MVRPVLSCAINSSSREVLCLRRSRSVSNVIGAGVGGLEEAKLNLLRGAIVLKLRWMRRA